MSLISRIKRLWELSGTLSDAEDERMAVEIRNGDKASFTVKKLNKPKQRLATVVQEPPEEFFPTTDENNDTTSERTSTD